MKTRKNKHKILIFSKLLKQYENEKFDSSRVFRLGMSLSGLQLNCKPVIWKASCEDSFTKSVLYVSLKEPFDHVKSVTSDMESLSYYVTSSKTTLFKNI